MAATRNIKKDTVYLIPETREKAVRIKDSMKLSMNALFNKAMEEFIERQELNKWIDGAKKASENTEYKKICREMDITGGVYEY